MSQTRNGPRLPGGRRGPNWLHWRVRLTGSLGSDLLDANVVPVNAITSCSA